MSDDVGQPEPVTQKRVLRLFRGELGYRLDRGAWAVIQTLAANLE